MKYVRILIKILLIFLIVLMIFIIGFIKVYGNSMKPNFQDGEIILYNKIANNYKRFDVVLVQVNGVIYVKRIIGMPFENVKYEGNKLYINNIKVKELYKRTNTDDFILDDVIPRKKYLVLGDNRSKSYDGRNFGLVDFSNIKGKVLFQY